MVTNRAPKPTVLQGMGMGSSAPHFLQLPTTGVLTLAKADTNGCYNRTLTEYGSIAQPCRRPDPPGCNTSNYASHPRMHAEERVDVQT